MLRYHTTVTSALQTVARLARISPQVAVISAPVEKAEQIAQRQVERYPTITTTHATRTALRRAGIAAIQLVILPPKDGTVTMFLMSNVIPPSSREEWGDALDSETPLTWRNYQLSRGKKNAVTWRLSTAVREHYRERIARLITGRGGIPGQGKQPYQLPDETARNQVLRLAAHLQHYPGLSGIRSDVFALAQHSTRLWNNTREQGQYPVWPTMPYARFAQPQMAPLADLIQHQEEPDHDQDQEIQ